MTRGNKATAPAPPPRNLTDDEFHKLKPMGQRLSEWRRGRRAERASRPKRPVHIHLGSSQSSQSTAPARRKRRATRLPRGHNYSRRRPKRGTIAGVLSVVVATVALTMAVAEFATWELASEIGVAAEFVSLGTAFCFGEPSDKAKLKKAQQTGQAPRQRTPAQPQKSAGHRCGAPTQDGSACQRPVKNASDSCWEHPGGQGTGKSKTMSTNGLPKRTSKKGAAPPAPASSTTP